MTTGAGLHCIIRSDMSGCVEGLERTPSRFTAGKIGATCVRQRTGLNITSPPAASDVVVVLSNVSGVLNGRVTLPANAEVASIALVTFPADERLWPGAVDTASIVNSNGLQIQRPRQDGSFTLRPILPGTYAIVALSGMTQLLDRSDPLTLMELLSPLATRVKVPEGGTTSIDIRLSEMPR